MDKHNCIQKMKELHASCNLSKQKCDILLDNLMYFCERYKFTSHKFTNDKYTDYNSESNKANCASVNTLGGVTLNLMIKSPT